MGCFYPKPGISTKEYFREFISHRCPYFFIYGAAKPPQNLSKRGRILKYLPNEWLNCWVIPWLPSLQSQVNNRNCPDTECSREMSKIWGAGSGWAACLRRHEAERTWGRIPGGETELKECSKLMKDPLCKPIHLDWSMENAGIEGKRNEGAGVSLARAIPGNEEFRGEHHNEKCKTNEMGEDFTASSCYPKGNTLNPTPTIPPR